MPYRVARLKSGMWAVLSDTGRRFGIYRSKGEARRRVNLLQKRTRKWTDKGE